MNKDFKTKEVQLLEEAYRSLHQLRMLCDQDGRKPEVRNMTAYKKAESAEISISHFLEEVTKVRSNVGSFYQTNEVPEPIPVIIVFDRDNRYEDCTAHDRSISITCKTANCYLANFCEVNWGLSQ